MHLCISMLCALLPQEACRYITCTPHHNTRVWASMIASAALRCKVDPQVAGYHLDLELDAGPDVKYRLHIESTLVSKQNRRALPHI